MMDVTDFGGQNWLIMPAARAVNEAAPANISRQRWLLVISGVTVINMQGRTSDDWLRDDIHILPDMRGPLDSAINQYGIPRPQGTEGLNYEVGFQLRQWSPFAGLSSTFDQDQSVNAGFAVDGWRPSPFTFGIDAFSGRQVNGQQVDTIQVTPHQEFIHKTPLTVQQLGSGDMVDDAFLAAGNAALSMKWCVDASAYLGELVRRFPDSPLAKDAKERLDYAKKNGRNKKICQS